MFEFYYNMGMETGVTCRFCQVTNNNTIKTILKHAFIFSWWTLIDSLETLRRTK